MHGFEYNIIKSFKVRKSYILYKAPTEEENSKQCLRIQNFKIITVLITNNKINIKSWFYSQAVTENRIMIENVNMYNGILTMFASYFSTNILFCLKSGYA